MNGLGVLPLLALAVMAVAVRLYALDAQAERQRANHLGRMLAIANAQRDAARAERDEAVTFADEALLISGLEAAIARHPSQGGASLADVAARLDSAPLLSLVRP